MAYLQVSRVASSASTAPPGPHLRVARVAVSTTAPAQAGPHLRVFRVSTVANTAPAATTVEPYAQVDLGSSTWRQTDGPVNVTITGGRYFTAPAIPLVSTDLTFTNTAGDSTVVTVLPHTIFKINAAGSWLPEKWALIT